MRRAIACAALTVFVLCMGLPLGAQSRSGSGNLRRITSADFLFLGLQDPSLYPETSVEANPANLLRLTGALLTSHTTVDLARSSVTSTRTDDTIGALGGTYTTADTTFSPTESAGLYLPLGDAQEGPRLGVQIAGDLASRHKLDSYENYRSFSEQLTVEERALPFSAALDCALGVPAKTSALGFALGYGFAYAPAVFPLLVDRTLNPVVASYGIPSQANDILTHVARATVGANLSISRAAELGLTIDYVGSFQDAARSYVAVDTDSDGRSDELMPYSDWVVNRDGVDKGGPAEAAISYSQRDFTVGTQLDLAPRLRLYMSDAAELFMGGRYFALWRSDRVQYQRPTYADDLEPNESSLEQHLDGSFRSFDATMGLGLATAKDAYFKVAVTYTRRDYTLRQDGTQANGDNLYSSRNPGHYTELALGAEPANNSIVLLLDRPTSTLSQSVALLVGWSYVPSAGIGLFVGSTVQGTLSSATYRAFNLDTRSVWEETAGSEGIAWSLQPVAGVRIRVSDKLSLGLSAVGSGTTGSLSLTSESAPFNLELEKVTLNGAQDLSSSSPFSVSIRLDVTAVL